MQSDKAQSHGAHGPTTKGYWKIALYLAILTATEVAVVYVDALKPVVVPILVILSLAKFVLVAMYFMHLRFDNPVLTGFFAAGFVIALAITLGILAQQGVAYIGPGA